MPSALSFSVSYGNWRGTRRNLGLLKLGSGGCAHLLVIEGQIHLLLDLCLQDFFLLEEGLHEALSTDIGVGRIHGDRGVAAARSEELFEQRGVQRRSLGEPSGEEFLQLVRPHFVPVAELAQQDLS